MDNNILESLTSEQAQMLSVMAEQPEILMSLSIAMLRGDVDTFTFTLAGMEKGKQATKHYFRVCLEFLQQPEIAKLLN